MKVYKLEIMVIDHEDIGLINIIDQLENANFANDCISPKVMDWHVKDIGEWHDDHPLNKKTSCDDYFNNLFA